MARYKNPLASGKYRNLKCPCGSGKKVKKCHGKDSSISLEYLKEIQNLFVEDTDSKTEES